MMRWFKRNKNAVMIGAISSIIGSAIFYLIIYVLKSLKPLKPNILNLLLGIINYKINVDIPVFLLLSIAIIAFIIYKLFFRTRIPKTDIIFKDNFRNLHKWVRENRNVTVRDSHLIVTASGKGCITKVGDSWRNLKIKFKTIIRSSNFSFIVRAKDLDNYVMIQCSLERIVPHYCRNSEWRILSEKIEKIDLETDQEYLVEIEVKEDSLKLFIDGVELFFDENILSDFKTGKIGFREHGNERAEFYDLILEHL